jgi:cytochrome c biogenesis protein ResB
MIKKIIKYLSSLRFTILLICLLGLVFMFGLWIPQKSLVKQLYFQWQANSPALVAFLDALQLTDIYTSPITLTLWGLFFLNLALVMWQRIPLIKKRIAISEAKITDPMSAAGYPFKKSYPLPDGMDGFSIIALLRKRGFTVIESGPGFYGVKNRLSPIAFGLFHLSFFLILIGGTLSIYSEFYGYLDIAEGESFQGGLEQYSQIPAPPSLAKIGSPPQVMFTVKKIVPLVSGFTETGLKVDLLDRRGRDHEIDINRPYVEDSTTFVLKGLGMSPLFVLKDPAGKEIDGAYVRLDCLKGKKDSFLMGGFEFKVKFYPDYVLEDGKAATRSLEFKNPVFDIAVERDKKQIAEGSLVRNGVLAFDGYRLEMREIPFWVKFTVSKEHGIPIIFSGFFLASLAVIWRLIWYRREIVGKVQDEGGERTLEVAGRSEFYKSLAEDEFKKLFSGIVGKSLRDEELNPSLNSHPY